MEYIKIGDRLVPYQIIRKNNKHTYLRIHSDSQMKIYTSKRVSIEEIERFILKHQDKIESIMSQSKKIPFYQENQVELFGKSYPINYLDGLVKTRFENEVLYIPTKHRSDYQNEVTLFLHQQLNLKIIDLWNQLKPVVSPTISLDGVVFKIQKMVSQFGSCHIKKRIIKLNLILVKFDERYLRSVLLHEITHLKITGHQANFYALLSRFEPNYHLIHKQLKQVFKQYEVK